MASRPFWSPHNHSRYSVNDAMSGVDDLADEAQRLGWPALGLTDHGGVAGLVQLYKATRKRGMEPAPGVELYVAHDRERKVQGKNRHLTVNAYTEKGYRNLCKLITRTAQNHFFRPIVDYADLAEMAEEGLTEGLSVATGCWFGVVPSIMREHGPEAALAMTKSLAGWFPRVYVELQNHGIENQRDDAAWWVAGEQLGEEHMVAELIEIANEAGLPYLITTDAHYAEAKDRPMHDALKTLCSWSEDPDDAIFPGEEYCLRDAAGMAQFFEPDVLETACENAAEFAEKLSVRIPELEKFRMLVPDVTFGGDPFAELKVACERGLKEKLPATISKGRRDRYVQRMNAELDVIETTGMSSYLLLVADVCTWMRGEEIVFNTRGSANDFLLCWLLGITLVDSVAWDLRPERFISADRTKPPDIDLDVEHERRSELGDWLATKWSTCQVGTIMKYKLVSAEDDEMESSKGSLRVRYFSVMNKQGHNYQSWRDVPEAHRRTLLKLAEMRLISGYGTHPAGYILAPSPAYIAELPMTRIGSGANSHMVTSYDKNDVEDLGFIKLDVLGLKTMTAVRIACRLIEPDTPPIDYLEKIPLNDSIVYRRISGGRTEGTFQLQEPAAQRFVQRMKPKNIGELIAAMALFRPAARTSGVTDSYLLRRDKAEQVPSMHPDLAAETHKTHGVLLYQEQVIGALRTIRMDMAELNTLLKAVKASNDYIAGAKVAIAQALPRIRELAYARGWSEHDVELLVQAVDGYADYGFNEAHAVAYGLLSYRTAWLAQYYPAQWWTGVLSAYSGDKKEESYVRVARRYGVQILPPHVNSSGMRYSYDRERQAVRRGLLSIDGVGRVAAAELADKQPFSSLEDLGKRCAARKVSGSLALATKKPREKWSGIVEKLDLVGALEGLE